MGAGTTTSVQHHQRGNLYPPPHHSSIDHTNLDSTALASQTFPVDLLLEDLIESMKASLPQMTRLMILIIGSILLVSLPILSCFPTVAAWTNPTLRNHRNGVVVVAPRKISHLFLSDKTEKADTSPPAPPVKCPNCDLCDGSGK
jgi:hypothetical protein